MAVMIGMVLAALAAPAAWANGVYIPEQAVLEMPRIPLQRALITYRNGVETLVLESALTTESKSVGWVVPLPGEPTKVELGDRDMLRMLAVSQGPEVVHDLSEYTGWPVLALICVIPLALAVVFTRNPVRQPKFWLLAGIVFCIAALTMVPQFTNAGISLSESVTVSAVHRLGDYETVVLRATTSDGLDEWLGQQGLAKLDAAAKGIVTEYIARNWCFVVSRLAADAKETAVPRPLVMSFATKTCVFPMRLTQLAGGTTRVELYVAADQQAQAQEFRCVAADKYRYQPAKDWFSYPVYEAQQIGLTITNADVQGLLWDGCVVTYLTADLAAAQMTTDVGLEFVPLKAYRERVYTTRAQWELTQITGSWTAVALVVVGAVVFFGRRAPGRLGRAGLISVLAVGATVIAGLAVAVSPVPTTTKVRVNTDRVNSNQSTVMLLVEAAVSSGDVDETSRVENVLPMLVAKKKCSNYVNLNPVTEEPLRYERTPGNLSTRVVDGRTYLCFYAVDGGEYQVPLFRKGTTQPIKK